MKTSALFAGFDFGTESVRIVIVDQRGRIVASATATYPHGQIPISTRLTNYENIGALCRLRLRHRIGAHRDRRSARPHRGFRDRHLSARADSDLNSLDQL